MRRPFAGNYTVWPGSHYVYERYFRERGERAMREPMPTPEIGEPVQLLCDPGDAVLVHYQLGHTAAVNTAAVDRIAVYFRVCSALERRGGYLTNMWDGGRWKLHAARRDQAQTPGIVAPHFGHAPTARIIALPMT